MGELNATSGERKMYTSHNTEFGLVYAHWESEIAPVETIAVLAFFSSIAGLTAITLVVAICIDKKRSKTGYVFPESQGLRTYFSLCFYFGKLMQINTPFVNVVCYNDRILSRTRKWVHLFVALSTHIGIISVFSG